MSNTSVKVAIALSLVLATPAASFARRKNTADDSVAAVIGALAAGFLGT